MNYMSSSEVQGLPTPVNLSAGQTEDQNACPFQADRHQEYPRGS